MTINLLWGAHHFDWEMKRFELTEHVSAYAVVPTSFPSAATTIWEQLVRSGFGEFLATSSLFVRSFQSARSSMHSACGIFVAGFRGLFPSIGPFILGELTYP